MKRLIVALSLSLAIGAGTLEAQILTNKTSTQTQAPASVGLSIEAPKAFAHLGLNFESPEALRKFSLNLAPVMEVVAMLEGRGAKVDAKLSEVKGVVLLHLTVDGKEIDPIVVECDECIIIFEY